MKKRKLEIVSFADEDFGVDIDEINITIPNEKEEIYSNRR